MAEKYYAMIEGEQRGPFSLEQLPGAGVRPSTYIWCKGMSDWQKAEENADVCRLFRNHLYDIMHPTQTVDSVSVAPEDTVNDKWKVSPDSPKPKINSRFDGFLQQSGEEPLPSLEEIEARQDKTLPPVSMVGYAWLVTFLCFPPTGVAALVYAYKSKKAWKKGDNTLSYDYCRLAKMWIGITFFVGLIGYGFILAYA